MSYAAGIDVGSTQTKSVLLDESSDLDPRQLQTLLGWTGRLLYTRASTRRPPERRAQPQRDRRPEPRQQGYSGGRGRASSAGGSRPRP